MSFPVANMSHLTFLYCHSTTRLDNPDKTEANVVSENNLTEQYSKYFNRLVEELDLFFNNQRAIQRKYVEPAKTVEGRVFELVMAAIGVSVPFISFAEQLGAHIPHLIEPTLELIHKIGEAGHKLHDNSHNTYPLLQNVNGNHLKLFVNTIAQTLTYRFRHEILTLSEEDCHRLAFSHFKLVIQRLNEIPKNHKKPFCGCFQEKIPKILDANDLLTLIMDFIDPNPKKQIEKRINDFINSTNSFTFHDFGEKAYLKAFQLAINNKDADLEQLISQCTNDIFFNSYFFGGIGYPLSHNNESLSLNNRIIKNLSLYGATQQKFPVQIAKRFGGDTIFTKYPDYKSMQQTTQDIVVLLMRAFVIQVTTGTNEQAQKVNNTMLNVISHLPYPQLKPLYNQIESLQQGHNELKQEVIRLSGIVTQTVNN